MSYTLEPPRSVGVVLAVHPSGMLTVDRCTRWPILDDGHHIAAVLTANADNTIAARIVELLETHGLTDVADTPAELGEQ